MVFNESMTELLSICSARASTNETMRDNATTVVIFVKIAAKLPASRIESRISLFKMVLCDEKNFIVSLFRKKKRKERKEF